MCAAVTDPVVDLLVLGSGIAGLSAAVRAAGEHGLDVGVVTKGSLSDAATRWAQGGVAAVVDEVSDSTELHVADTLSVGAGLCDVDAVRAMVAEGPARVGELIAWGARFDRDAEGALSLGREGGHSASRVVHAGGAATGAEIERVLVDTVRATAAAVHEHVFAVDLVVDGGRCCGVRVRHADGSVGTLAARNVLLATGGAGQLYSVTTNPLEATGDGIAMALRAGVACADLEFVQFHPTALAVDRHPRPLITEALRGDGAVLRDSAGERFVDELSARDVVSRAMTQRMLELGVAHLWLDCTDVDDLAGRYPTIVAMLANAGLDPTVDWLPVAPAAHYLCGGVITDLDGATTMAGLWAAGEVACSGVHGANRLASNSLLEGLVFGTRAAAAVAAGRNGPSPTGAMAGVLGSGGDFGSLPVEVVGTGVAGCDPSMRASLQRAMTEGAGVVRDEESLAEVAGVLDEVAATPGDGSVAALEVANLAAVGSALVAAARRRTESRGAHTRIDAPDLDGEQARRVVCRRVDGGAEPFDVATVGGAG